MSEDSLMAKVVGNVNKEYESAFEAGRAKREQEILLILGEMSLDSFSGGMIDAREARNRIKGEAKP